MSETIRMLINLLASFVIGVIVGWGILPILFQVGEQSGEYMVVDMEVAYLSGDKELIHDVARVEINDSFLLMFDGNNNIKAIISNEKIKCIKSAGKDII